MKDGQNKKKELEALDLREKAVLEVIGRHMQERPNVRGVLKAIIMAIGALIISLFINNENAQLGSICIFLSIGGGVALIVWQLVERKRCEKDHNLMLEALQEKLRVTRLARLAVSENRKLTSAELTMRLPSLGTVKPICKNCTHLCQDTRTVEYYDSDGDLRTRESPTYHCAKLAREVKMSNSCCCFSDERDRIFFGRAEAWIEKCMVDIVAGFH